MKAKRQVKILEIIRARAIETQEQLAQALREEGIRVTQATISRDIKELKIVKVPSADGSYRYAQRDDSLQEAQAGRMMRIFRECVTSVDRSDQMVVIDTLPATAQGIAEAIDGLRWPEVLGTLAGERTVFVVVKPAGAAPQVVERLQQLMQEPAKK